MNVANLVAINQSFSSHLKSIIEIEVPDNTDEYFNTICVITRKWIHDVAPSYEIADPRSNDRIAILRSMNLHIVHVFKQLPEDQKEPFREQFREIRRLVSTCFEKWFYASEKKLDNPES